jgi:hypothetical protein
LEKGMKRAISAPAARHDEVLRYFRWLLRKFFNHGGHGRHGVRREEFE